MVTGASDGIGREIALGLARLGAAVVMVCRNPDKGRAATEEIRRKSPDAVLDLMLADLSSQAQVRRLAEGFKQKYRALNVLVNNAGIVMDNRALTEDGVEMTLAVNYLAPFLLTVLLVDVLKAGSPSRIVNMTSMVHRSIHLDLDNLQGEKRYSRDQVYGQSKLADIFLTYELARRLQGTGVTANCVCPGAVASNIWTNSNPVINAFFKLMKGPQEGARLPLYLASSEEVEGVTGGYFQTRQNLWFEKVRTGNTACPSSRSTYDLKKSAELWEMSKRLTGLKDTVI